MGENFLQEAIIRDRIAAAAVSRRVGAWLAEPANAQRVVDEVAEVAAIALSKVRDDHIESLVRDALTPRFREEPIAPLLGGLLSEALRRRPAPRAGRPGPRGAARLAGGEPGHGGRGARRAGAVVGAAAAQRGGDRAGSTSSWSAGSRTSATTRGTAPGSRSTRCSRQLADDLLHDPDTQARAEALKERVLDNPAVIRSAISLWDALRRALTTSLQDPQGAVRAADADRGHGVRRPAQLRRRAAGPAGRAGRGRRGLRRRPVRRRGDRRDHPHDRAVGRPRRPPAGSSCTSAATCSSSGSTARSSAAWSACSSTRSASR